MLTWQKELRWLLDSVPGGAERLIRAVDEGRIDPENYGYHVGEALVGCAYCHIYGNHKDARQAAERVDYEEFTPLERHIWPKRDIGKLLRRRHIVAVREECVRWLAEHGGAVEPAVSKRSVDQTR